MKKRVEFRPATLNERKEFYQNEFDIEKVKGWFINNGMKLPQLCAIDAGTETGIIIDKKLRGNLLYFPFNELNRKIIKYIPEDVYYSRNYYLNPKKVLRTLKFDKWKKQEFVFDIDSDNIKCKCSNDEELCENCINKAFIWAKRMKKELKKEFRNITMVYSGRGFHLHILDEVVFYLSLKERNILTKRFSKYPIDPWVSRGYIDLIRLPYSLNGLVSRKVITINNLKFYKRKSYPKFLLK